MLKNARNLAENLRRTFYFPLLDIAWKIFVTTFLFFQENLRPCPWLEPCVLDSTSSNIPLRFEPSTLHWSILHKLMPLSCIWSNHSRTAVQNQFYLYFTRAIWPAHFALEIGQKNTFYRTSKPKSMGTPNLVYGLVVTKTFFRRNQSDVVAIFLTITLFF